MTLKLRNLAIAGAMITALVAVPAANADPYASVTAARAAGDPSGSAAGHGQDARFTLKGKNITPSAAANQGLVCNETDATTTQCFTSSAEADEAAVAQGLLDPTKSAKVSGDGASGSCSANDGTAMKTYRDSNFNGWQLNLYSTGGWYDLTGQYNDAATSYQMGGVGGHYSSDSYAEGLGPYYPGPTGVCGQGTNMGVYGFGSGTWNDHASSRFRG